MFIMAEDVVGMAGPYPSIIRKACSRHPVNDTTTEDHELERGLMYLIEHGISHKDDAVRAVFTELDTLYDN